MRRLVVDRLAAAHQAMARASIAAGVRAAVAITAPLLLSRLLDMPLLSWTALGAFLVAFGDPGGSDRARLRGTLAVASAGAIAVASAALFGANTFVAGVAMLLCAVAGALALRGGKALGLLGTLATEAFIVSLAAPATAGAGEAVARGLAFGAGGLWVMFLLIVVWPLRRGTPASAALAHAFSALAAYGHALTDAARLPRATRRWKRVMMEEPARVRERLARAATLVEDEARVGPHEPGARLVLLLAIAEEAFALQLALADDLDPAAAGAAPATAPLLAALEGIEGRLHRVGAAIRTGSDLAVGAALEPALSQPPSHTQTIVRRLHDCLDDAERVAGDQPASSAELAITGSHPIPPAPVKAPARRRTTARDAVRIPVSRWWSDPIVRHALRLGALTAAMVWGGGLLGLERPQWITLTILFTLQPQASSTRSITRGRVIGTAVGALLLSLAGGIGSPLWLCAVVFVLAAAGVAVLNVSHAAFCLFLTPLAVLLAAPAGVADAPGVWHLAVVRVVTTCLGAALSLAAVRFLWPEPEPVQLRARIADVVVAIRDYLHSAMVAGPSAGATELADAQRRVGDSLLAADERLAVARRHAKGADVVALATLLERLHRLALSISALTCVPEGPAADVAGGGSVSAPTAAVWRAAVAGWFVLHRAADAVREGHSLEPQHEEHADVRHDLASLQRLAGHLEGVRAAVRESAITGRPPRTSRAA